MDMKTSVIFIACVLLTLTSASNCSDGRHGPAAIHSQVQRSSSRLDADSVQAVGVEEEDSLIAAAVVRFVGKNMGKETVKKVFPLKPGTLISWTECKAATAAIALGRRVIRTESVLWKVMTGVCLIGVRNYAECSGIASLFSRPIFHIVTASNLTSEEMTSVMLGSQCMSRDRFRQSRLNWEIPLPADLSPAPRGGPADRISPSTPHRHLKEDHVEQMKGSTIQFLQLTDVHLDSEYSAGQDLECGFPLCCRKNDPEDSMTVPAERLAATSGDWGSLEGNCDCPLQLAQSALSAINETISRTGSTSLQLDPSREPAAQNHSSPLRFILWTGDILPHNVWSTSKEQLNETAVKWTQLFDKYLGNAGVPVVPVLGNHEAIPVNMFAPPGVTTAGSQWIYQQFYTLWHHWFALIDQSYGGNAKQTFPSTGSYAFSLSNKTRIIVLNTVYSSRQNYWNLLEPVDIGGQLSFLVQQLAEAEGAGQKAVIVGHNPPNDESTDSWLHNYIRVMRRFKSVISGSFFGHTHSDHYYLYGGTGDDGSHAYATAFIGGSITPFGHVNPCYKIYTMSQDKGLILDQETFYVDVEDANTKAQQVLSQDVMKVDFIFVNIFINGESTHET